MRGRIRVLFDTNVLVSAALFGGVPKSVVEAARTGDVDGAVSLHILGEFREVLMRPHFGVPEVFADALAEETAEFCAVVPVERARAAWSLDPGDDPVVEAALRARADVLVTGDAQLLRLEIPGVRVLTPSAMLRELEGTGDTDAEFIRHASRRTLRASEW